MLESCEVATVDRGYHVYMTVWEAAVGQILPSTSTIPTSFAVVENNDTPSDNNENFRKLHQNREIHESFHPRKIPAIQYCIIYTCSSWFTHTNT